MCVKMIGYEHAQCADDEIETLVKVSLGICDFEYGSFNQMPISQMFDANCQTLES